jgi:ribosome-associated protein
MKIKKSGYKKISIEGEDGLNWIVIDLEDIIVHLFKPEVRDYYNLEKIWNH